MITSLIIIYMDSEIGLPLLEGILSEFMPFVLRFELRMSWLGLKNS